LFIFWEVFLNLYHIYSYIKDDLNSVQSLIHEAIDSKEHLIRQVGNYLLSTKGKKIRPTVVLLSGKIFEPDNKRLNHLAAALELLHNATLLHDDVIDKATLRRGKQTVNAQWGDDVAILMADYLFSKSFDYIIKAGDSHLLRTLANVTSHMCEGEMYQIEKRGSFISRREYLKIIENKTAQLFSACSGLAARIANASTSDIALLSNYGLAFGMAFQISDDTLDFIAQSKQWGKSIGNDISEGKQTLPFIIALESAEPKERSEIEACFNNGRNPTLISHYIEKYNGFQRSLDIAKKYARSASDCIKSLPDSSPTKMLSKLATFAVDRAY
jgi:octaprenyl-diphosphate synthase